MEVEMIDTTQNKVEEIAQELSNTGGSIIGDIRGFITSNKNEVMIAGGILAILWVFSKK